MKVNSLFIFPVKGCAGIRVTEATVDKYGLQLDRNWVVVDAADKFVTQRDISKMVLIRTSIDSIGGNLTLNAPDLPSLTVPIRSEQNGRAPRKATVWGSVIDGFDEGHEAATWLSKFLEGSYRLVFKAGGFVRALDQKHLPSPGSFTYDPQTAFSDGYPFLVTTVPSLRDLNEKLGSEAIDIIRFRPNIVIDGDFPPFDEESWKRISIAGHSVFVLCRCTRCTVPNVNPETGEKSLHQPFKTLQAYRRVDKGSPYKSCFGMNAAPADLHWRISVGDPVTVVETGEHCR